MTLPPPDEEITPDPVLRRKLAACQRLIEALVRLSEKEDLLEPRTSGSTYSERQAMPRAIFEEFGKAIRTFRACVQLASTGYGPSAFFLSSIVLESSLIVLWAVEQPGDVIDGQADLHSRYGQQCDLDERRRIGIWKSLPEDDYISDAERAEALATFGPDAMRLWTGHASMSDLIDEVAAATEDDFTRPRILGFKVMLNRAAATGRGTGIANQSQRTVVTSPYGGEVVKVNIGQGAENCSDALHTATAGLLPAFNEIAERYAPDLLDDVRRSEALVWRAWKDPLQLEGLKDNDPCPCDRPDTLWGQCHKWTEKLGTIKHEPLTDSDVLNFTPYVHGVSEDANAIPPGAPEMPVGPCIFTFTFRLPFTLGLLDTEHLDLMLSDRWKDPDDIAHFGKVPAVRLRLHNEPTDGTELWPGNASSALRSFYGDIDDIPTVDEWPPIEGAYEQWVSLETASGRLESESEEDAFYAFHRVLQALNTLLMALDLAVTDSRIATVSTHEIGAVVFCGIKQPSKAWMRIGDITMHPDSFPFPLEPQPLASMRRQVGAVLRDIRGGRPFLLSNLWYSRAIRAQKLRGDDADCVVSLQTAGEAMLYDLMRGLLVDLGKTSREISDQVGGDLPFATLIKGMPNLLGGNWSPLSAKALWDNIGDPAI